MTAPENSRRPGFSPRSFAYESVDEDKARKAPGGVWPVYRRASEDWRRGPALRLGSKGEAVRRLQERLRALGFDPGPADGVYGYLTMGAVRDFQRACGLGADGVVGRRTRAALSDDHLTFHRGLEVVAEIRPDAGRATIRALARQSKVLRAVSWPWHVGTDGTPACGEIAAAAPAAERWLTLHNRQEGALGQYEREAPASLQALLHARAGRRLLDERLEAAKAVDGDVLHLDLGRPRWGDGPRFMRALRRAAALARAAERPFAVSLPLWNLDHPWARLTSDLDYAAVGASSHRVVLVPPTLVRDGGRLRPPSPRELAAWVRTAVRRLPPWRCLLALNLTAHALLGHSTRVLPYARAVAAAYGARTRPQWDEAAGRPAFSARLKEGDAVVWLETAASFGAKMDVVRRYRLAGVYMAGAGAEDVRIWRVLRERLPRHGDEKG